MKEPQPEPGGRLEHLLAELGAELRERLAEQQEKAELAADEHRRMLEQCLKHMGVPRSMERWPTRETEPQDPRASGTCSNPTKVRARLQRARSLVSWKSRDPESRTSPFGDLLRFLSSVDEPAMTPQASDGLPGVSVSLGMEEKTQLLERGGCGCVAALVRWPLFDYCVGLLVIANTLFIALQADFMAQHPGEEGPREFDVAEIVFAYAFLVELLLRLLALRRGFFTGKEYRWNILDMVIVTTAMVEEVCRWFAISGIASNVTFLRVMRILKLVRVMRIVRVVRVFRELRVMMLSMLGTMRTLFWTLVVLFLVTFVFGVYLATLVSISVEDTIDPDLKVYFGSLPKVLLSLFQATTGGLDWEVLTKILQGVSAGAVGVFLLYICVMYYAIMNILTGVCVNHATKAAEKDVDNVIREELFRHNNVVSHLQKIFHEADVAGTGTLTWLQLRHHLRDAKVRGYFKTLDLEAWDLHTFFDLLQQGDQDEQPCVGIDQFVRGCIRLKSQVKNVDLMALKHDEERLVKRSLKLQQETRDEVRALLRVLVRMGEEDGITAPPKKEYL
mmetsp:Transcript_14574/g.42513  ORF Transcript_14574/g.42513 Transcript_14574/m.42513 type:complete len:560 (+) Transcript_14574:115-1794(+)